LEVILPPDVDLDLGATAKALAADRAAARAAQATRCGVLVNLGGDLAVAGPAPASGWQVTIADDHTAAGSDTIVSIRSGGLATSSISRRRWRRAGRDCHHIVDPRTGDAPPAMWRTVSVAAANCVDANTASTAAIIEGPAAPSWLAGQRLPARLVDVDGRTVNVAGWPSAPQVAQKDHVR
jgi:thiamine biosynthesis lipoprotein